MKRNSKDITDIATEVAAQLAATAQKTASNLAIHNPDHDAITTLLSAVAHLDQKFTEKFQEVRTDINELKSNTVGRIDTLEINTITKIDHEKVTIRLDSLEDKTANYMITLGIYTAVGLAMISLIIYHMFQ